LFIAIFSAAIFVLAICMRQSSSAVQQAFEQLRLEAAGVDTTLDSAKKERL